MFKKLQTEVRAIVYRKDGSVLKKYPWKKAKSIIKQFMDFLYLHMCVGEMDITQTSGEAFWCYPHANNFNAKAAAGVKNYGMVIGSGENAVAMDDFALQTLLSTNITYNAQTVALETPSANVKRIAIARSYVNNSGATLGIKEVGLYLRGQTDLNIFCIERTLYSVDVPDGGGVAFTLRITISL